MFKRKKKDQTVNQVEQQVFADRFTKDYQFEMPNKVKNVSSGSNDKIDGLFWEQVSSLPMFTDESLWASWSDKKKKIAWASVIGVPLIIVALGYFLLSSVFGGDEEVQAPLPSNVAVAQPKDETRNIEQEKIMLWFATGERSISYDTVLPVLRVNGKPLNEVGQSVISQKIDQKPVAIGKIVSYFLIHENNKLFIELGIKANGEQVYYFKEEFPSEAYNFKAYEDSIEFDNLVYVPCGNTDRAECMLHPYLKLKNINEIDNELEVVFEIPKGLSKDGSGLIKMRTSLNE